MSKVPNLIDVEDLAILQLNPVVRKHAVLKPTVRTKKEIPLWKKNIENEKHHLIGNFLDSKDTTITTESEAVQEARRCLKCADAPCTKSCPTQLDIRSFIYSISNRNFYGAAKQILSDNPNGASCGNVCPVSSLCVGACNLKNPINISGLQSYALKVFRKMNIKQIRDPKKDFKNLPKSYETKIALIGCGPSSISCATYLGRMGYKNVVIFEKTKYGGGLSTHEIPQNRLSSTEVQFEISLMKDLGVKIEYGKELGKDFTIESLKKEGFKAFYMAIGLPEPKLIDEFKGLSEKENFFSSKTFLPKVSKASKPVCCAEKAQLPKLHGHVVVLGAGDTAMDCASSAVRCGAKKVSVILRRSFSEIRAVPEERDAVVKEHVNFLTNCIPKKIETKDGKISAITLSRTFVNDKKRVEKDGEEEFTFKCDYVISAFGSGLYDTKVIESAAPMKVNDWGLVDVNERMETNVPYIFAGGDLIGNGMTVEATNDGKTASWYIHEYVQTKVHDEKKEIPEEPTLPNFYTDIDKIDISVEMCGVKFENPFGFASAPPATTASMIARGFEQGWSFAVTKSFCMDFDAVTNVAPRIVKPHTAPLGTHQEAFMNIELISEKSAEYWLEAIKQLKKKYPKKIIVASIMAGYVKSHWQTLAAASEEAGADIIELNMSCPHGMGEKGMGLACGQSAKLVKDICAWVRKATKLPFFAKMTPNITDIVEISKGAKEGGADGVVCTNTVSALIGLDAKGVAWPNVNGKTTYGGLSGNAIRPIALKATSSVWNKLDKFPIMGTGGIENAQTALQFIHCGASVCQVSSSVHNHNYQIIDDWCSGLRSLLWTNANKNFDDWDGCSAPVQTTKLKRDPVFGKGISKMGEYLMKQKDLIVEEIKKNGILVEEEEFKMPEHGDIKVPTVNDVIGKACQSLTGLMKLDPKSEKHVVADIDEDFCINCGKCYQTCADTGYQCISFDPKTHIPSVDETKCTGCGLCISVCPATGAMIMIPRDNKENQYHPKRGIAFGKYGKDSLKLFE